MWSARPSKVLAKPPNHSFQNGWSRIRKNSPGLSASVVRQLLRADAFTKAQGKVRTYLGTGTWEPIPPPYSFKSLPGGP